MSLIYNINNIKRRIGTINRIINILLVIAAIIVIKCNGMPLYYYNELSINGNITNTRYSVKNKQVSCQETVKNAIILELQHHTCYDLNYRVNNLIIRKNFITNLVTTDINKTLNTSYLHINNLNYHNCITYLSQYGKYELKDENRNCYIINSILNDNYSNAYSNYEIAFYTVIYIIAALYMYNVFNQLMIN